MTLLERIAWNVQRINSHTGTAATTRRALKRLDRLGDPDSIAAWLERSGYRGRRLSAFDCPIALYLRTEVGRRIVVSASHISLQGDGWNFAPPKNVKAFLCLFDAGEYDDLVESEFARVRLDRKIDG